MNVPYNIDPILKGTIVATDDMNLINSVPNSTIKILSLDEENRLNPNLPSVVVSTCLLPPMAALMAESDGDEDLYDMYYYTHLNDPFIQQFMAAIISWMYRGGSFIIFAPQMRDTVHILKLRQKLWMLYGIGFGIGDYKFELDFRCIPIWLNLMFRYSIISPYEYLTKLPKDAKIDNMTMQKLIANISPYAENFDESADIINRIHQGVKNNKIIPPGIHRINNA